MISTLIKSVMDACNLQQRDLADLLGVSLDRVKSLTSGRAKKLKPEESEALASKLNISASWLVTGKGPMFQGEGERELHRRLLQIKHATDEANLDGLSAEERAQVQEILFMVRVGDVAGLRRALAPAMTNDERDLLSLFRAAPLAVKAAAIGALQGGSAGGSKIRIGGSVHGQVIEGSQTVTGALNIDSRSKKK